MSAADRAAAARYVTRDVAIANGGLPLMRLMAAHDAARVRVPSSCPLHRRRRRRCCCCYCCYRRRRRRDRRNATIAAECCHAT